MWGKVFFIYIKQALSVESNHLRHQQEFSYCTNSIIALCTATLILQYYQEQSSEAHCAKFPEILQNI